MFLISLASAEALMRKFPLALLARLRAELDGLARGTDAVRPRVVSCIRVITEDRVLTDQI